MRQGRDFLKNITNQCSAFKISKCILTEILSLAKNDIDRDISLDENDIDRDISLAENDIDREGQQQF